MTKDKLGDKFSKFLEGQGIEVVDVTPKKQKPIMAKSPQLKPNNPNDWSSRFDKKFTRKCLGGKEKGQYMDKWFVRETTAKELKNFISSELQRERERVIEEFAKIVDKYYDKDLGTYDYKQIAEDFISEINSLKKKMKNAQEIAEKHYDQIFKEVIDIYGDNFYDIVVEITLLSGSQVRLSWKDNDNRLKLKEEDETT